MQITKAYSGDIGELGAQVTRTQAFGNTNTITVYSKKSDFINQTIADFLHNDCGVDAVYEAREGSTDKFLWINNVPFLYVQVTNNKYLYLYGPLNNNLFGGSFTLFSGYNATVYSFSLIFTGNPNTAFSIRFKDYDSTNVNQASNRFMAATNLANGKKSLVWINNDYILNNTMVNYVNGIDLNEDGTIDKDSFSNSAIAYLPQIYSKAENKSTSQGKYPLVPIVAGVWKLEGCYCHLKNFGLPAASNAVTELQTEFEMSGRKFINTVAETIAVSFLNMGLIEVTE